MWKKFQVSTISALCCKGEGGGTSSNMKISVKFSEQRSEVRVRNCMIGLSLSRTPSKLVLRRLPSRLLLPPPRLPNRRLALTLISSKSPRRETLRRKPTRSGKKRRKRSSRNGRGKWEFPWHWVRPRVVHSIGKGLISNCLSGLSFLYCQYVRLLLPSSHSPLPPPPIPHFELSYF